MVILDLSAMSPHMMFNTGLGPVHGRGTDDPINAFTGECYSCKTTEQWDTAIAQQRLEFVHPCACGSSACQWLRNTTYAGFQAVRLSSIADVATAQLTAMGASITVVKYVMQQRETRSGLFIARAHYEECDIVQQQELQGDVNNDVSLTFQVKTQSCAPQLIGAAAQRDRTTWGRHGTSPPIRDLRHACVAAAPPASDSSTRRASRRRSSLEAPQTNVPKSAKRVATTVRTHPCLLACVRA
jgi:hypothetical protein